MCFRNLPIEFDADGKARLKEGLDDPWGVQRHAEQRRRRQVDPPAIPSDLQRTVMRAGGSHAMGVVLSDRRAA